MKLGIDIRSLTSQPLTGVGYYVATIINEFSKLSRGTDMVYLVSSGIRKPRFIETCAFQPKAVKNIHIKLSNKIINSLFYLQLPNPLRTTFRQFDYVWLPNINFYDSMPSIPYAVTVHDLSFLRTPRYYSTKMRLWHAMISVQRLLKNADTIIAVSRNTRDDVRDFFPDIAEAKIRVLYPTMVPSAGVAEPHPAHLPDKYILYLGTLEPRKNVSAVVEAFRIIARKYPDISLVLVGSFGWSVKNILSSIKHDKRIIWLGYVSDQLKLSLYQGALIFVWPSFYEGYGFPPLEALHAGTTVVTSYRSSLPEVLKNRVIYVNPFDVGQIAEVVQRILGTRESYIQFEAETSQLYSHDGETAKTIFELAKNAYAHRD